MQFRSARPARSATASDRDAARLFQSLWGPREPSIVRTRSDVWRYAVRHGSLVLPLEGPVERAATRAAFRRKRTCHRASQK